MTYNELYNSTVEEFKEAGIPDAITDTWLLMENILRIDKSWFLIHRNEEIAQDVLEDLPLKEQGKIKRFLRGMFYGAVRLRIAGKPVQYILGSAWFMGLEFNVNENVLIPRQDTEILAELAVEEVRKRLVGAGELSEAGAQDEDASRNEDAAVEEIKILDMCTGSGCLGISIAAIAGKPGQENKQAEGCGDGNIPGGKTSLAVTASDISEKALKVAKENAGKILGNEQSLVGFVLSDLFENISGSYDVIVSNPPYIKSDVIPTLMREVKDHEPMLALDGGTDGLDIYKRLIKEAPEHLNPGGKLMLEIGYDQGEDVTSLMREAGFTSVSLHKDMAGLDRVVQGKLPSKWP